MSIVESQNFSHTISESNSKMESRHRYFIKTFANWMKINKKEARLFKTHATWHKDYATSSTINKTSITPLQHRQTVSPRQHQTKQRFHKHSPHTIVRAMPTPDLASACYLDHDTPIRSRNPHRRGTAKYTKRANINRNIRLHLRNDRKQTQEDATHLQQVDLHHHNTYYALHAFDEWHHRTRFIVGYNKILISRWTQIYQRARYTIRNAQRNDNISATTHDLMQLILVKEIHHARALADTGTLIPKGCSGYKLFPTPKQAARIDHFCEYLYKLLQDPMSTLRFQHPVLTHLSPLQDDITDDALADVDVHLDSMDPRHQSRWGEHNIQ